jgi:uncharacterized protein
MKVHLEKTQVDILGLSTSPASGGAFALILKETNGTRRLPIIIGAFEAQAIAIELENIKPPRPLTHDLVKSIIESMSASISEVIISELKEGTFYAKIILDTLTGTIEIDSRPSDAIAIGVRFGAPLYVDEDVLREAGFEPEVEPEPEQNNVRQAKKHLTKEESMKKLQTDLDDAIKNEDYEKAIRIRDEIKNLNVGN